MRLAKWLLDHNCRGIINAVFGRMAKRDEILYRHLRKKIYKTD
ncbi:hypothetical protein AALB47_13445 [Lachnospiraceae bacterium 54-11]